MACIHTEAQSRQQPRGEELVMAVCSDISGQIRGKAFPEAQRAKRLRDGIGWCPTQIQLTSFGDIAPTPYGSLGDLTLMPDVSAEYSIDFKDGTTPAQRFVLGDLKNPDGSDWNCCLRSYLRNSITRLRELTGIDVLVAFEHEFYYSGADHSPSCAYNLAAFLKVHPFARTLLATLRAAGLDPDTFMPEAAPGQCEVTISPKPPLEAADQAVVLRQVVRETAIRFGERVSFTPLRTAGGVGNGLHIHLSFWENGRPITYDASSTSKLSRPALQFASGVLRALPQIIAITASSVVSYQRLVPHRWSAPFNNLGYRDREAALRICPGDERKGKDPAPGTNLEFRASDCSASPYLQLGAILAAGTQGVIHQLSAPTVTHEDLSVLEAAELASMGIERLPLSLGDALDRFEKDEGLRNQLIPRELADLYLQHKRHEVDVMKDLDEAAICERYAAVF
eukprot:jgi/Bigna1/137622/aug1.40_g12330